MKVERRMSAELRIIKHDHVFFRRTLLLVKIDYRHGKLASLKYTCYIYKDT